MTTLATPPVATASAVTGEADFGTRLRNATVAVRLSHEKLGVRKALTREQLGAAAEPFGAQAKALSASKKLIDTSDATYRAVVKVRHAATRYWKSLTVPYPENGVRLLRRTRIDDFTGRMREYREELESAAAALEARYTQVKAAARIRLGDLFNPLDYPTTVADEFAIEWEFVTIDPPAYLKKAYPELYEQEAKRIAARFEESVQLAEHALTEQFGEMIGHLVEVLTGEVEGKPRVFRDSTVTNLQDFFERFKSLSIGSNAELDALVAQAQQVVAGVDLKAMRKPGEARTAVAEGMTQIRQQLEGLMIARPRRAIDLGDEPEQEGGDDGLSQ